MFKWVKKLVKVRMLWCAVVAFLMLLCVGISAPQQLPVILYKVALISLAAVTGYWIDRWAFPYARPDGFLNGDWREDDTGDLYDDANFSVVEDYYNVYAASLIRRALIMGAAMLAVGLGL